jgi:hypothetical protein
MRAMYYFQSTFIDALVAALYVTYLCTSDNAIDASDLNIRVEGLNFEEH